MNLKSLFKLPDTILVLVPLVLFLSLAILLRASTYAERFIGDEGKFYEHAEYITQGKYTSDVDPNLKEGPGYPIYLAPYAALDIPYVWSRVSHIIFLVLGCWYLFLLLRRYLKREYAIILTYIFVLYPPLLRWVNLMYAESLMLFLLLGFCYHFIRWYKKEGNVRTQFFLASLFLGYLALTKIIFAYVILVALALALVFSISPKLAQAYRTRQMALILGLAMLFFSPYVVYTYQLTGKFFYLGMHGGRILYFRSTPFENEFGNSFNAESILYDKLPEMRKDVFVNLDKLRENHGRLFAEMEGRSNLEKDSIFKARAFENIRNHPFKYLKNTAANVSRLFFHLPFSYRMQNLESLGYLIPNIFIVVLAVLGLYPAVLRFRSIPKELIILMVFSLIYLGGHSLLGGRGRFLIPVVPVWLIFFSYIYTHIVQIRLREHAKDIANPESD